MHRESCKRVDADDTNPPTEVPESLARFRLTLVARRCGELIQHNAHG